MAKILKLRVKSGLKRGWLLLPATCFVALFAAGIAVWPQTPAFNITLAGQSMIRSDFRVHTPAELATISPLLTGDVIFTNFEATVVEKGQSLTTAAFLSPPEALDALKALGFNLLALSDNHSFDLKVSGIQNTLREVKSRNIVHAGIGNNVAEAAAPGYLHTPKGTVALVAMASGLIARGRIGHRHSSGRERAAHRSRRQAERVHDAASCRTGERAERGRQAAHSSEHPRRAPACRPRDRVRTQSRLSEPPVRGAFPRRAAGTAGSGGLAQEMDARRNRCRRGYHRDAWRASAARRGDLSRPADLLRSGQLHF